MTISHAIEQAAASTRTESQVREARATKTAHTPGPWTIRTKRGKTEWTEGKIWVDGPTGLNPNVSREKFGPPICEAHNEANARLIAAAPALLIALQEIIRESDKLSEHEFRLAAAAISYATGIS